MRPVSRRIRRLARWLGTDNNPLRRRTDRIETVLRIVLVLAFLIAGPLLAGVTGRITENDGMREVRSQQSWHLVSATLLRNAPRPYYAYGSTASFWVPARWHEPSGATRVSQIPVTEGMSAGSTVHVWVDPAGQLTGHGPLTPAMVTFRVVVSEVITLAALVLALLSLGAMVKWLLNRRRLAAWATEWSAYGPRWTSRR